MRLQNKVR